MALAAGVGIILAFGYSQFARRDNVSSNRPDSRVAPAPTPQAAFPGASQDRTFLSLPESSEAARRGLLPPQTRSILKTGGKLKYGDWVWDAEGVPAGPVAIRVDLARQLVSVFRGRDEIGTAVIVYGMTGKESPVGKMPILGKSRDYHSKTYDAPMPFSLWIRNDGVAIHGSTVTSGHATNGCIGIPNGFAAKLFEVAEKGDIVEIIGETAPV